MGKKTANKRWRSKKKIDGTRKKGIVNMKLLCPKEGFAMLSNCPGRIRASGQNLHRRRAVMDWNRIEGNWKQLKGKVREKWGKLTDDNIDIVAGKREQLAGKIQEAYGVAKDDAERQIDEFSASLKDDWDKDMDRRP